MHGLLQPIIINDYRDGSYEILAGNTRAVAWQMLWGQGRIKSAWIPSRIMHLPPLEAERLLIESNRQREKTAGQKTRETHELLRIFSATQSAKEALQRIARETKQGLRTVKKQAVIATFAGDRRNAVAQTQLKLLDDNKTSVNAAYREVVPQKRTFANSPLGQRVRTLDTLAKKLPNDLQDPRNKEFRAEAIKRIGVAVEKLCDVK